MSKKLCEVPMKRSIRGKRRMHPRRSAYLRQIWLNRSCVRLNPCMKPHYFRSILKRRYGIQMEGNPQSQIMRMKSRLSTYECLWLSEYKSSTSIEGVRNEKIRDQIHKDSYPELGCSGNLSLVVTVHPVNVGTLFSGLMTGLAAVDVECRARSSRSSLSGGKPRTWRRAVASSLVSLVDSKLGIQFQRK